MPETETVPDTPILTFDLSWAEENGERIIRGCASDPEEDKEKEIMLREALEEALPNFMYLPIIHLDHTERPIGLVKSAYFDTDDKFQIDGRVKPTSDCDDVWSRIKSGELSQYSIFGRRIEGSEACSLNPRFRDRPCITKRLHLDYSPSSIGVVQIATGCVGRCRYCITRNARGYIRSIPESEILGQITRQVQGGAVEIRLTGQDVSAYGLDQGPPGLPSLLHSIGNLPGRFKVRVGMMNPATVMPILSDLADSFVHENIFAFLHLPVQSGSDLVLRRMERGYMVQDYLEIISVFREEIPGISLSTDFIVGFPGESADDFSMSCELVRKIKPESVNVTRYSYRPGSMISAADDLLERTKKERSRELIRISHEILQSTKQGRIGSVVSVLVTEKLRPGSVTARSDMYHNVIIRKDLEPGSILNVRIIEERTHYLIGEEISP